MAGKKTNGQLGNERVQVVFKTRAPPKNWITLFTNPITNQTTSRWAVPLHGME